MIPNRVEKTWTSQETKQLFRDAMHSLKTIDKRINQGHLKSEEIGDEREHLEWRAASTIGSVVDDIGKVYFDPEYNTGWRKDENIDKTVVKILGDQYEGMRDIDLVNTILCKREGIDVKKFDKGEIQLEDNEHNHFSILSKFKQGYTTVTGMFTPYEWLTLRKQHLQPLKITGNGIKKRDVENKLQWFYDKFPRISGAFYGGLGPKTLNQVENSIKGFNRKAVFKATEIKDFVSFLGYAAAASVLLVTCRSWFTDLFPLGIVSVGYFTLLRPSDRIRGDYYLGSLSSLITGPLIRKYIKSLNEEIKYDVNISMKKNVNTFSLKHLEKYESMVGKYSMTAPSLNKPYIEHKLQEDARTRRTDFVAKSKEKILIGTLFGKTRWSDVRDRLTGVNDEVADSLLNVYDEGNLDYMRVRLYTGAELTTDKVVYG